MMSYTIHLSRQAKKCIDKLRNAERLRIREKIDELSKEPYGVGKALLGPFKTRGIRSCRVGDHRILYTVLSEKQIVLIVNVDRRRRIYKRG
ncbi:MAG: type II toxin-antitoxin system RelE/ParE family toxin [Candidatus Geothermarchaeales archaeon]